MFWKVPADKKNGVALIRKEWLVAEKIWKIEQKAYIEGNIPCFSYYYSQTRYWDDGVYLETW